MKLKRIIYQVLGWFPVGFLTFSAINAIFFTPMIRWKWGFYNDDLIITMILLLLYMLFITYWNTIKIKNLLVSGGVRT